MSSITLDHVSMTRDGVLALDDVSLEIGDGRITVIVGPTASGKSTLLRAIAGLEPLQDGRVLFDEDEVTEWSPQSRDLAMVFQTAPLQPRLSIERNLGLALEFHDVDREEIDRRVEAEARAFGIRRLLPRRPSRISDGERHGAATARTLVRRPRAILMDEPLTGIDNRWREKIIRQLLDVQRGYAVTMVIVTNDQAVAGALGDDMVVLHEGRVRQTGTFTELYHHPADTFVAGFVGSPSMNLLTGVWVGGHPHRVAVGRDILTAQEYIAEAGERITVGIRPEDLTLVDGGGPTVREEALIGTTVLTEFAGSRSHVHVDLPDRQRVLASVPSPGPQRGEVVALRPRRLHLFDVSGQVLRPTA